MTRHQALDGLATEAEAEEVPPPERPEESTSGPPERPAFASPSESQDREDILDRLWVRPPSPRPGLEWLDDGDSPFSGNGRTEDAMPPVSGDDRPVPVPEPRERGSRWGWVIVPVVLGLSAGGYFYLRPEPAPTSPALDVERQAPAAPADAAEPLIPIEPATPEVPEPGPAPADPEPTGAAVPETLPAEPAPPPPPMAETLVPEPAPAPVPPRPDPAPDLEAGERLVQIVKQLETHQALIERLERSERILRDRLEGLEMHAQAAGGNPGLPAADRDEAEGTAPSPSPKPLRKRVPPSTTSRPVKTLQRRVDSPQASGSPLPFSVESVDTWNGEPTIVLRSGGRLVDVRPGASHQGWRIEAAHGQSVTLRGPNGVERTLEAGQEGGP